MKTIRVKQNSYAAELFLPDGEVKASCLFLPGFPYSLGKNAAITWLTAHGYAVLFVQPPGTYDSDGAYTPNAHVELLDIAIADAVAGRLTHAKTQKKLDPIPAPRGVISHSFGTIVASDYLHRRQADWALLFAPILGYRREKPDYAVREDLDAQITYVQHSRPYTFRLGSSSDIISQSWGMQRDFVNAPTELHLIGVVGGADSTFDVDLLGKIWGQFAAQSMGSHTTSTLRVIDSAGHGITELFTVDVQSDLLSLI